VHSYNFPLANFYVFDILDFIPTQTDIEDLKQQNVVLDQQGMYHISEPDPQRYEKPVSYYSDTAIGPTKNVLARAGFGLASSGI
jgi:hypothetical protein